MLLMGNPAAFGALNPNQVGDYEIIAREDGLIVGKLNLSVTTKGSFSGVITQGTGARSLKGKLVASGGVSSAAVSFTGASKTQIYQLQLLLDGDGVLACVLIDKSNSEVVWTGGGVKRALPEAGVLAGLKGPYTMVMQSASDNYPYGSKSYASIVIDQRGMATITGVLLDGTKLTGRLVLDDALTVQVYLLPYGANGYLQGELQFEERVDHHYHISDGQSEGLWLKSPILAAAHPDRGELELSPWAEPWLYSKKTNINSVLGWENNQVMAISMAGRLRDGGRDISVVYFAAVPVTVQFNSKLSMISHDYFIKFSKNKWKASLNASTGVFSGSYLTYSTVTSGGRTKIVSTRNNTIGGVFMIPGPSGDSVGQGIGLVREAASKGIPFSTKDIGFVPKP